jgi:hypothetical protein
MFTKLFEIPFNETCVFSALFGASFWEIAFLFKYVCCIHARNLVLLLFSLKFVLGFM